MSASKSSMTAGIDAIRGDLAALCSSPDGRPVGTTANRAATRHAASVLRSAGLAVDTPRFGCLAWDARGASLRVGRRSFEVQPGPFSPSFSGRAELAAAGSVGELRRADPTGRILLLHGRLAREPLASRNYVFYNPEEHQEIYGLLDQKPPLAVIAATGVCPSTAGAAYPFPLFDDGDFDIPSAYMRDTDGARLLEHRGCDVHLTVDSSRRRSWGCNVIGRLAGTLSPLRIVVTAHADTRPGTPGALDDASGVAAILELARIAAARARNGVLEGPGLEVAILNGEDYYSAPGEMAYMEASRDSWGGMVLAVNVDGAGYREGETAYSLYGCSPALGRKVACALAGFDRIVPGEEWVQGDHSMFVMKGVPALAFTSSEMGLLWSEIAHTERDRVELVDPSRLGELALAIDSVLQGVSGRSGRARR